MANRVDTELQQFQTLMTPPGTYEEGFSWKALAGAVFIALLMVPGSIYMGLLMGQDLGQASQWVTLILFVEVARRAQQDLKRPEVFVIYYMAAAAMGLPFAGMLWQQYFARSQAAQAAGITAQLPHWYAPALDSHSYAVRSFFNLDWLPAIGLFTFTFVMTRLNNMVVGYGLFRVASDVEHLPFPMAPVGAQGVMALAEEAGEADKDRAESWRWRVFAIGGALGLVWGILYILVPQITGGLTNGQATIQLWTIPWVDTTTKTQNWLPAVATGWCFDVGQLLVGMVLPFFAMIGSGIGLIATVIANPILQRHHILSTWHYGNDTITTNFSNFLDFYFSLAVGLGIAIAIVGFFQLFRDLRRRKKAAQDEAAIGRVRPMAARATGRGDIPPLWIIVCYFTVALAYILVCGKLINWHPGVMIVLVFFGVLYTPIISYVSARLEGMVGQNLDIPYIREASLIASGFRGAAVWFIPLPMQDYGGMTRLYRQCQLTGTKFSSIWKTELVLVPIILISSFAFMNFIWGLGDVPSGVYQFANKMWPLQAAQNSLIYSSTLGDYSRFSDAFNPMYVAIGAVIGVVTFLGLDIAGAPIFLTYGLIRGIGNGMPHYLLPQLIGAFIGRFYFQKKLKLQWRQYVPVVFAGFLCGTGLINVLGVGIIFLAKSVVKLPF